MRGYVSTQHGVYCTFVRIKCGISASKKRLDKQKMAWLLNVYVHKNNCLAKRFHVCSKKEHNVFAQGKTMVRFNLHIKLFSLSDITVMYEQMNIEFNKGTRTIVIQALWTIKSVYSSISFPSILIRLIWNCNCLSCHCNLLKHLLSTFCSSDEIDMMRTTTTPCWHPI